MQLVADRFVVSAEGRAIDLSSGEEVLLVIGAAGRPSEQARWAGRCDRLSRLRHRGLAPLIDYGPLGEARRFEAWGCGAPWRGSREQAARAVTEANRFLRAIGVTEGGEARAGVHAGHPMVLPGASAGFETDCGSCPALPLEARGVALAARSAVAAIAEILTEPAGARPRAVAIWGPCGAGVRTAVGQVARAARLTGFVPLATHLADPRLVTLIEGRSLLLIDQAIAPGAAGRGWRRLVGVALRSPKAHLLLFAGREEIRGVPSLRLEPLPPAVLAAAVVPGDLAAGRRDGIARAARRSGGVPGRFVRLLWGADGSATRGRFWPHRLPARAAEEQAYYGGVAGTSSPSALPAAAFPSAHPPSDLVALRRRMQAAADQIGRGRRAPGERGLRAAVAALARRHDWAQAARGALALARSIVNRGGPGEGQVVLAEAREYAERGGDDVEIIAEIAVASGNA